MSLSLNIIGVLNTFQIIPSVHSGLVNDPKFKLRVVELFFFYKFLETAKYLFHSLIVVFVVL